MEEEIKKKKENYLREFDSIFKTNVKNRISLEKVPLIAMIYENFTSEIMNMNDNYLKLRNKSSKYYNELEKVLNKKQIELLEKYLDSEAELSSELAEQIFIFGFIFAKEIEKEKDII